ncbi:hypothetical protein KSC_075230 [Ktedonobacter sp. SOSP1-52]|uniref:FHA domain-containing protein n=1 Tax=Ktedonobacter sp. SOSP1-52 TaxID=2778366 RepID=UPI001916C7F8|nr:FHA domain-containing protein [Ktedonobacter sp. SOSP1-52]GHO68631.1 hypothetical protein KSC_075230 [Ktedonobacter sp. SOSP1-52]
MLVGNILYAYIRKRGARRQLLAVSFACIIAALLVIPAFIWYALYFHTTRASLSFLEALIVLAYLAICGWLLPIGASALFLALARPRVAESLLRSTSVQTAATRSNSTSASYVPPRYIPGNPVSLVFGEETPWAWLEYRNGNFQGQRLAFKRAIMTIGRDENCDIWLDDDMVSRHHAEIVWDRGMVFVTDCGSMNGLSLNGQRVKGFARLEHNDLLEVGSHRFIFALAESQEASLEESDPLAHHKWRLTSELGQDTPTGNSRDLPATRPLTDRASVLFSGRVTEDWKDTAEVTRPPTPFQTSTNLGGALTICDGELVGRSFMLERAVLSIGRGIESDIVINDSSISRRHAQFLRQADGDYVQDLNSRNGTRVNDEYLTKPRLLQGGDIVSVGNIRLEYISMLVAHTSSLPHLITPRPYTAPISGIGPAPIKLPSRQK